MVISVLAHIMSILCSAADTVNSGSYFFVLRLNIKYCYINNVFTFKSVGFGFELYLPIWKVMWHVDKVWIRVMAFLVAIVSNQ